jgi:ABC-type transport system involved in multi-copper enzyme maturation, permease component
MLAIWKREFRSYLHTVIGWLFMAVILFFVGLYFTATNLLYGSAYFSNVISACGFILLLAVPILTMRCLAEERKNKTDQLILTAPVSLGKIIAGKFLALASIFTIPILVICLYPLILMKFGNVPVAESYMAILGFYLYGLACMAVGVFISSLTESQVIAAVLSFAALFVCYIMSGLCNMISSEGNVLTKILGCFDFYTRFSVFLTGTLDLKAAIYFITVILLLLFLTCQSIQKRRWSISVKSLKTGVFSSGMIAAAIAVTVLVNLVADQLPLSVSSIDMTSNHLYSLTDDTVQFLKNMQEDVTIYVYGKKSTLDETISRTLSKYESESSHIKVEYKDPVKYPNFASDYSSDTLQENSLIVVGEKRNKVISYEDMYETQIDYNTYSQQTTGYDGEGRITSALDYVTAAEMPVVYRITGHDEQELDSSFRTAMEKANLTVEDLNLMDQDKVPEDADAIMILAPLSDFSTDDAQKVKDYMAAGGKAIVVTTYTDQDMTNFKSILDEYGVSVTKGILAETDNGHYYQNPFYLIPEVKSNTYTSDFADSKYVFAPYAQGLTVSENDALSVTQMLVTSENAVVKDDPQNMTSYESEDGDETGQFTLGAKVEKTADDTTSTLFVFSSENLFTDESSQMVGGSNLQLFTRVINDLSEEQSSVSIPVKEYTQESITVPQNQFVFLGLTTVILLPVLLLTAGIVIWVRRRRR